MLSSPLATPARIGLDKHVTARNTDAPSNVIGVPLPSVLV